MSQQLRGRFPLKSYERIKPKLGGGSFGSVWKYKRIFGEDFPEFVAVKVCSTDFCESEIEVLEKVANNQHENLIHCFGIEEKDFNSLFVLELCDSDLHDHLKKNRHDLDQQTLLNYSCQITNGIHHLHGLDIVHRDIKPKNILVKKSIQGTVLKVTDFGGSKQLKQKGTQAGTAFGTEEYMSPEMLSAAHQGAKGSELNPMKSDIYSLGLMFVHIHHGPELVLDIFVEKQKTPIQMVSGNMKSCGVCDMIKEMLKEDSRERPSIVCVKLFLDAEVNKSFLHKT